jgi:acyl-CoA reductase-like NAD-dependent aldehyde dehydrogenase
MFAEILLEAGLPPGAFNLVTGGDAAGRALVQSKIDGIVLTG